MTLWQLTVSHVWRILSLVEYFQRFTVSVQHIDNFYSINEWLIDSFWTEWLNSGWLRLIDWMIDWLIVSWTLSLTGHTGFLTSIGCLSASCVLIWFIHWLVKLENEHCGSQHQAHFVLKGHSHLFGKSFRFASWLTNWQMNPLSLNPVSVWLVQPWASTCSISNWVHSFTKSFQPWLKSQ